MKTNENKVVFIHSSGQKIVVEDQESANALEKALNQYHHQQWIRVAAKASDQREIEELTDDTPREFFSLKELKVILVCGKSSFRSTSCRVSNTALLLKTAVPFNFIGVECVAYISNGNLSDQIELSCTVYSDQRGESVLDFTRSKVAVINRLEAWI